MEFVGSRGEAGLPPRKRRRTALSCFNCRRRKLQCDRNVPSCSRCLTTGMSDTCGYDHHSPGSTQEEISFKLATHNREHHSHTNGETLITSEANHQLTPTHVPSETTVIVDGKKSVAKADSNLLVQEERIRQLESRLVGLESLMRSSHRCTNSSDIPEQQPAIQRGRASLPSELRVERVMEGEAMLRGQHFETRFFGFSHPSSILGQVLYAMESSNVQ